MGIFVVPSFFFVGKMFKTFIFFGGIFCFPFLFLLRATCLNKVHSCLVALFFSEHCSFQQKYDYNYVYIYIFIYRKSLMNVPYIFFSQKCSRVFISESFKVCHCSWQLSFCLKTMLRQHCQWIPLCFSNSKFLHFPLNKARIN